MTDCNFPTQCNFPNCFCTGLKRKEVTSWAKVMSNQDHRRTPERKAGVDQRNVRASSVNRAEFLGS